MTATTAAAQATETATSRSAQMAGRHPSRFRPVPAGGQPRPAGRPSPGARRPPAGLVLRRPARSPRPAGGRAGTIRHDGHDRAGSPAGPGAPRCRRTGSSRPPVFPGVAPDLRDAVGRRPHERDGRRAGDLDRRRGQSGDVHRGVLGKTSCPPPIRSFSANCWRTRTSRSGTRARPDNATDLGRLRGGRSRMLKTAARTLTVSRLPFRPPGPRSRADG